MYPGRGLHALVGLDATIDCFDDPLGLDTNLVIFQQARDMLESRYMVGMGWDSGSICNLDYNNDSHI